MRGVEQFIEEQNTTWKSTTRACIYQWSGDVPEEIKGCTVILAADCCYSQATTDAFCDTLDSMDADCPPTVLLGVEYRSSTKECFDVLEMRGWDQRRVDTILNTRPSHDPNVHAVFELTKCLNCQVPE